MRTTLCRCIDDYHWSWGLVRKLVNRRFGCAYTQRELQVIYRETVSSREAGCGPVS